MIDSDQQNLPQSAGIIKLNRKWHIDKVNKKAEAMLGRPALEFTGRPADEIFFGLNKADKISLLCQQAQKGKSIVDHPVQIRDDKMKHGRYLLATILPQTDKKQADDGAILSLQEPNELRFAQYIIDSSGDGLFTVDRTWKITSFNKAAERITGWAADQVIGKSCSDVFQSSICGKNCSMAESLYTGRNVTNRSITIQNSKGETLPVSICASPLADHEGTIIGGVQSFRDLSILASVPRQLNKKYRFNEIVSKSRAMQRLFTILPDIACSPSTVMIYGESGTGKELFATALYNISDRKNEPFVALNCGALPETLLESELFGYKAGAFTDAHKDKPGRLAAAEGGTLFLDEIGDIPSSVQVKLLRVLQERVYEPLGSNTPVNINVRIITATNRDLKIMVQDGRFREDLYYRLNVVKIHLPPLRERKEDIHLLIDQFIQEFSAQQGKDIVGISNPALNILMRHNYPGNIRELKNIIEYAFILCDGGYILKEHLPEPYSLANELLPENDRPPAVEVDHRMTLEETEKQAIYLALENNQWKKASTCSELGISKDTLRRKMQKYCIEKPLAGDLSV